MSSDDLLVPVDLAALLRRPGNRRDVVVDLSPAGAAISATTIAVIAVSTVKVKMPKGNRRKSQTNVRQVPPSARIPLIRCHRLPSPRNVTVGSGMSMSSRPRWSPLSKVPTPRQARIIANKIGSPTQTTSRPTPSDIPVTRKTKYATPSGNANAR